MLTLWGRFSIVAVMMHKDKWFVFKDNDILFPRGTTMNNVVQGLVFESSQTFVESDQYFCLKDQGTFIHTLFFDGESLNPDFADWESLPVRTVLGSLKAPYADGNDWQILSRFLRAFHAAQWHISSRFCGFCGAPQGDAEDELARQCTRCGRLEYPRITPAVIVAITDGQGRLLLAHNGKFKNNVYALIAGFVEAGERLEDTVHREVREEVGIEVDSVTYVASQPWPFPASLMLAFEARYKGGELRCDGKEILDARWVTPDTLPELPAPGSISRFLIDRWLTGRTNPCPGHR